MNDLFDRFGVLGLKALRGIFAALPLEMALALGRFAGRIGVRLTSRRRSVYADLKAVFADTKSESELQNILSRIGAHFGMMFVETLRSTSFDSAQLRKHVQIHHWDRFEKKEAEKKGVIFLTAHLGNWELVQMISHTLGHPIHVLAQAQKHPRMDQYLNHLREIHGGTEAVLQGMGIRGLYRVLRKGGVIGLLGDRSAGKQEGIILPFLGRKTTVPTGAFELAQRTGAAVVPVFFVRGEGSRYDLIAEEPIECGREGAAAIETAARKYIQILESYIEKYPDQWLWFGKRWKYAWTKRLLVLSDGKAGHEKQSEALAHHFRQVTSQYGRPGMEYPAETVLIQFKSRARERIFYFCAVFLLPFAQGHLSWLRFFLTEESWKKISRRHADFIISAGSGLTPLNLWLARDFRAKSIVMMKPSFPYQGYDYDLAVVPAHDRGWIPRRSIRPVLTPNPVSQDRLKQDGEKLAKTLSNPSQLKIALFLGGPSRKFQISFSELEMIYAKISRAAQALGCHYGVTTSRRTPENFTRYFHDRALQDAACQIFVDVRKDTRPEVAGGLMALADILIVTEDSISMISEAVSSGKKVMVLTFSSDGLPEKHRRFRQALENRSAILCSRPDRLDQKIQEMSEVKLHPLLEEESRLLQSRLQEIL